MLDEVQALIKQAAKTMGLDDETIESLLKANAEHEFEIELDDKKLKAYRVQHNNSRGPYKGGIRFNKDVGLNEAKALATMMSLKTAALDLPLGGGKGGVAVDPRDLEDDQVEHISREYVRALQDHIGPDKDVPAPDVNTNAKIIDWMVDEYEQLTGDDSKASFTGKSLDNGGSQGREAATGRGGVFALAEFLKQQDKSDAKLTYAVQGYGNVGSFFGSVAADDQPNWTLVAASDSDNTVYNKDGIDAKKLAKFKADKGRFSDYGDDVEHKDSDAIIGLDVDVLVLAALDDAVNKDNMKGIKAKYVVELANGPVTGDARQYLVEQGVYVLPDIIANAGGVVVSYLEWKQNKDGEQWSETKVNQQLQDNMTKAVKAMSDEADKRGLQDLSEAAYIVAIQRLTS